MMRYRVVSETEIERNLDEPTHPQRPAEPSSSSATGVREVNASDESLGLRGLYLLQIRD